MSRERCLGGLRVPAFASRQRTHKPDEPKKGPARAGPDDFHALLFCLSKG